MAHINDPFVLTAEKTFIYRPTASSAPLVRFNAYSYVNIIGSAQRVCFQGVILCDAFNWMTTLTENADIENTMNNGGACIQLIIAALYTLPQYRGCVPPRHQTSPSGLSEMSDSTKSSNSQVISSPSIRNEVRMKIEIICTMFLFSVSQVKLDYVDIQVEPRLHLF